MLLVHFTKGQHSPRTNSTFGDHFASFSLHSLVKKDERTLFSFSFLLDSSLLRNGRTSW